MSDYENELQRPPFSDKCRWCGKTNLEWRVDDTTGRWALYDQSGKKHVHQPSKDDEE